MSYNISKWRGKRLEGLRIPVDAFFTHQRTDWHPEKEQGDDGSLTLGGFDSTHVRGNVLDGILHVTDIECQGEGSGTFFDWILEPALQSSTGELEVVIIWEGGDSIERLVVKDGVVTRTPVKL